VRGERNGKRGDQERKNKAVRDEFTAVFSARQMEHEPIDSFDMNLKCNFSSSLISLTLLLLALSFSGVLFGPE
jgi:hypothetical protein